MRVSGSGGSAPGTAWGSGSACVERCEPSCWGLAREPTGGATGPLQGPKVHDGEWGPWRFVVFVCDFWLSGYWVLERTQEVCVARRGVGKGEDVGKQEGGL